MARQRSCLAIPSADRFPINVIEDAFAPEQCTIESSQHHPTIASVDSSSVNSDLRARFPRLAWLAGILDRSLARLSTTPVSHVEVARLRWFWLDGLFSNLSASFFVSFVPLFAVAYGATNTQVGQLSGIANLCALIALLPGAQAATLAGGRRK